jgi:hypothetical protein
MGRIPKRRPEVFYVVVIEDRPLVAFKGVSLAEARPLILEQWFLDELKSQTSEGTPLWDGTAKLVVRTATGAEVKMAGEAINASNETDELQLAYLVKVDRPDRFKVRK